MLKQGNYYKQYMTEHFNCESCDAKYKTKTWLEKHVIEKHTGVECSYCKIKMEATALSQHKCLNMELVELRKQIDLLKMENSQLKAIFKERMNLYLQQFHL